MARSLVWRLGNALSVAGFMLSASVVLLAPRGVESQLTEANPHAFVVTGPLPVLGADLEITIKAPTALRCAEVRRILTVSDAREVTARATVGACAPAEREGR